MRETNLNLDNYGLNQPPPSLLRIEDFIDNGWAPPPPQPQSAPINQNLFNATNPLSTPKTDFNVETKNPFILPTIWGNRGIGNDIFGSQAVMAGPRERDRPVESPTNREFAAFLLSDLGRQTLTQNKLSIRVESGDIFYNNHNTDENFYNFLLSQQNDEAAYMPKEFSYNNSFEKYITTFLQAFSIDDQEKLDLLVFKNSKYLFYRFNDFVKTYGNTRYKLLHTRKMLDSVGLKKVEDKNKHFLIEKIIHGVEFENAYQSNPEKNPEIMETKESNCKVAGRVYKYLY